MLHSARAYAEGAHEDEKPAQSAKGEDVDDAGAFEPGVGNEAREGQSEKDSAEGGTDGVGELEDGAAPGDGVDEVLFGDEVRNERRTGWTGEGATGSNEEQDCIDGENAVAVEPSQRDQRGS